MSEKLKPKALVLTAPGINRDHATAAAFELAGAQSDVIHINQLKSGEVKLGEYQVLSIPGGFSYGDHIQGGRILALEFRHNLLADQIYAHLEKGRLILGVCNGFQILVQSGLLPFGRIQSLAENQATLTTNIPDRFQSRWIYLTPRESKCFFATEQMLNLPVAHGEGRFLSLDESTARELQETGQIVYQYCDALGNVTETYPDNPNGAPLGIAAICDPSGQILGMMPHAEDFVHSGHHPNWRTMGDSFPDGLKFFQTLVRVAGML